MRRPHGRVLAAPLGCEGGALHAAVHGLVCPVLPRHQDGLDGAVRGATSAEAADSAEVDPAIRVRVRVRVRVKVRVRVRVGFGFGFGFGFGLLQQRRRTARSTLHS